MRYEMRLKKQLIIEHTKEHGTIDDRPVIWWARGYEY